MSSYVLSRALPSARTRFEELLSLLGEGPEDRYVLAELNDLLARLAPAEFGDTLAHADLSRLAPMPRNYVAAMVEHAAHLKGTAPPPWTADVAPLESPHFTTPLAGLRLHLLRASPVPFKRRNIFVDASVGALV
jgi:hypothetical protein